MKNLKIYEQEAATIWDATEVMPVWDDGEGNVGVCEPEQATYWSVYLHQVTGGGVQCVADLPTKQLADDLAKLIDKATSTRVPLKPYVKFKPEHIILLSWLKNNNEWYSPVMTELLDLKLWQCYEIISFYNYDNFLVHCWNMEKADGRIYKARYNYIP